MTRIIELIKTEERRGTWTDNDPYRSVEQLWTKDWRLIVEQKTTWDNWIIDIRQHLD